MIAIINGKEGDQIKAFKGGFGQLRMFLLSDGDAGPTGQILPNGTPLDVTGDTVSLEVYDTTDRRNAAVGSLVGAISQATAGYLTVALNATNMTFGPGTYFVYAKRVENTGTTTEWSRTYTTLVVN